MPWLALLLLACQPGPSPDGGPPAASAPPPGDPALAVPVDADPCASPGSWARTGQPFMLTWCTGCHSAGRVGEHRYGAPEGLDLDTLADTRAWQARILDRVEAGTMPPGGGPPAAEQARLALWLSCGAPGEDASLSGGADPVGPVAADTVVVISAGSASLAGGIDWILRTGDIVSGSSSRTRVVETYDVDGEDAWLWSREQRDASGGGVQRWSWDPPLPVGQAGSEAWTAASTLTYEDEEGGVTVSEQVWGFERAPAVDVDGWSIDGAPVRVLGLAEDGAEEAWEQSSTWGISARWWLDAEGGGVVYQQALDQAEAAFLGDFPLIAGDRRGGRLVELEVRP